MPLQRGKRPKQCALRRAASVMGGEMPADSTGKRSQPVLAFSQAGKIAGAQVVCAQCFVLQGAAHRFKYCAPIEGKLFLGRVKDLDQDALDPSVRRLRQRRLDSLKVTKKVGQEHPASVADHAFGNWRAEIIFGFFRQLGRQPQKLSPSRPWKR